MKEKQNISLFELILNDRSYDIDTRKKIKAHLEDRIPKRFQEADLAKTEKKIQEYYTEQKHEKVGLFLTGESGTGKTYSVYALAIYLLISDYDVHIFNLPRLLNMLRLNFDKEKISDIENIEDLTEVEILIIDDIGAEKTTEWVNETLYYLINTRYEKMKTTIFTSNLSLDEISDKISNRIASRISEMCIVYKLSGDDKRLIKNDKR